LNFFRKAMILIVVSVYAVHLNF